MKYIYKYCFAIFIIITIFAILTFTIRSGNPWIACYDLDNNGHMVIKITNQEIARVGVSIYFKTDIKNFKKTNIKFNKTIKNIPFGNIIHQDITTLPGRVQFTFQDNHIEMMESKLVVNYENYKWRLVDGTKIH